MSSTKRVEHSEPVQLEEGVSARQASHEALDPRIGPLNEADDHLILTRATKMRLICAGYSFFCAGVNDGSLGPIIPYLLSSYNINTNFVSIV